MKILAFGIAKDIVNSDQITFPIENSFVSMGELKQLLFKKYPDLGQLPSLVIAVNLSHATPETIIYPNDEIALIPPVSGG